MRLNCRISGPAIYISLNKNSNYCYMPRSSKHSGHGASKELMNPHIELIFKDGYQSVLPIVSLNFLFCFVKDITKCKHFGTAYMR